MTLLKTVFGQGQANKQRSETKKATLERRKNQNLKVYELKVNIHNISKDDLFKMAYLFIQAKWIQNDKIASKDIFNYKYKEYKIIENFDKDRNKVQRALTINTGIHQALIKGV